MTLEEVENLIKRLRDAISDAEVSLDDVLSEFKRAKKFHDEQEGSYVSRCFSECDGRGVRIGADIMV